MTNLIIIIENVNPPISNFELRDQKMFSYNFSLSLFESTIYFSITKVEFMHVQIKNKSKYSIFLKNNHFFEKTKMQNFRNAIIKFGH